MDMRPGRPDAGVVDGQHRSMSPVHAGRPDRIGSLLDDACPTAGTPDTGLTERLRCPFLPIRLMIRRVPRSRCLGLNPSGSAVCH